MFLEIAKEKVEDSYKNNLEKSKNNLEIKCDKKIDSDYAFKLGEVVDYEKIGKNVESVISGLNDFNYYQTKWESSDLSQRKSLMKDVLDVMLQGTDVPEKYRNIVEIEFSDKAELSLKCDDSKISFLIDESELSNTSFKEAFCDLYKDVNILDCRYNANNGVIEKFYTRPIKTENIISSYAEKMFEKQYFKSHFNNGEILYGSASSEISNKIKKAEESLEWHRKRYENLLRDKANGMIGVDPGISEHKHAMNYYKNQLSSLRRDYDNALANEKK